MEEQPRNTFLFDVPIMLCMAESNNPKVYIYLMETFPARLKPILNAWLQRSDACPFSAGALVDMFGDYSYMFYMCGVVMLTAGLFLFAMNYYNYRRNDATQRAQENAAELAESSVPNELRHGDTPTCDQTQGRHGPSRDVDPGTPEVRSETEDIPV